MNKIYYFIIHSSNRHRRDNMSFEHVTFEDVPTNDDINVFNTMMWIFYDNKYQIMWMYVMQALHKANVYVGKKVCIAINVHTH